MTWLDLTDGMNEWRETNTLQLNMTHKHEHEKETHTIKETTKLTKKKKCKENIWNLKLFSGNTVQNK